MYQGVGDKDGLSKNEAECISKPQNGLRNLLPIRFSQATFLQTFLCSFSSCFTCTFMFTPLSFVTYFLSFCRIISLTYAASHHYLFPTSVFRFWSFLSLQHIFSCHLMLSYIYQLLPCKFVGRNVLILPMSYERFNCIDVVGILSEQCDVDSTKCTY